MADGNRIIIDTADEDEAQKILDVLQEAEENGEIDFAFNCFTTRHPK